MATFQTSNGNVTAENGSNPGQNQWKSWPAKGDRKEDKYYSLHFASNASYGKGVLYIEAQFRNPFHADVASRLNKGDEVIVTGELTGRKDDKGRTWLTMTDAKFQKLPPKKAIDDVPESFGGTPEVDEDLPF